MNIASLLAARDLRQRPLRTSLTILSVALGVATILGVSITNESTTGSFRTMVDTVIGKADFWVEGPTDLFGTDALARIQNVAGVRTAAPALQTQGRLRNKKDSSLDILGIEPSLDRRIRSYRLAEGRFLANEERAEIVLVKSFARRHDINRGDKVVLLTHRQPLTLRVVGILEKEGAGNLADGRTGFLHIGRTQELLGVGNMMSYASVQVADAEDADETRELVQGELGSSYRAIQPEQRVEAFDQVLSGIRTGLSFFSGIAVFVGAFLIYNTFSMIALERIRELGILRALGLSRRQAVGLVLREAAIVGVAGSVIGALLGVAVARILLESTAQMVNTPLESFIVPSSGLLLSFIVGLAITLIAALQPAWTAGRVSPLGAVTLRAQSQRGWAERLGWIPGSLSIFLGFLLMQNLVAIVQSETIRQIGAFLIMLGASLFLPVLVPQLVRVFGRLTFLLSVSFRMGLRNMQRNPVRASTTVGAIMIALAMILSVGGMNVSFKKEVGRWVDQSIGADAVVASGAPEGILERAFEKELRQFSKIEAITPVRYFQVVAAEVPVTFRAIEPRTYKQFAPLQVVEGNADTVFDRLGRGGSLLISTTVATNRKLNVGDTVRISTNRGPVDFEVAGVVVEFFGSMGDVVIGSWSDMEKYFGVDGVSAFRLKLRRGADSEAIARSIETRHGERFNLQVFSNRDFQNEVDRQVNASFASFNAIVMLAAVVAAFGITNTLLMNIFERAREIGILRALGFTKRQIRKLIVAEALSLGLGGEIFGLLVGSYLSVQSIQAVRKLTGFAVNFSFPAQTAFLALGAGLLLSYIAAVYPARQAASTVISKTLRDL